MQKVIFSRYGIDIIERDSKLYIKYDSGHFSIKEIESEITEDESLKAQKSEKDAYKVIIATQNRERDDEPLS